MDKEICILCNRSMGNSNNKFKNYYVHKKCLKNINQEIDELIKSEDTDN